MSVQALLPGPPLEPTRISPPEKPGGAPEIAPESRPAEAAEEVNKVTFELTVSQDKLQASVFALREGNPSVTAEDLKAFLKSNGIGHGVVNQEKMEEYIREGALFLQPCLIAEGKPAEPGKNAQVAYHFDKDPLKIGSIKAGGTIDFKDKGEIPQVKEGDLLAEKTPLVKAVPGMDVFGKKVLIEEARDVSFVPGTGARKSADGLKIIAQIRGRPELMGDGRVCVFPELKVKGDAGVATGHIRFEGFVDVEGAVQQGYQIKAGRLAAGEVYRAEIEVDGDAVINGGIVGSKVTVRGNLKTRFIHSSQVKALGNVIVEREVIDSKLETNGALIAVPSGKIFTSHIIAKKGISANQIGSASSKPCSLLVGVDTLTQAALKNMNHEISGKENEKKNIREAVERLSLGLRTLKENIEKSVQTLDQARSQQSGYEKMIAELREGNDRLKLAQTEREMKKLEGKIQTIEGPLQKIKEQEEKITEKITTLTLRSEELDAQIAGLKAQIQKISEEGETKESAPVKVIKNIFAGTVLEGRRSSLILSQTFEGALVKETKIIPKSPGEAHRWEMQVFSG